MIIKNGNGTFGPDTYQHTAKCHFVQLEPKFNIIVLIEREMKIVKSQY